MAFSARCKKVGLIPPSLRIKPPIDTTQGWKIADRASRQFLNERLRVANYRVHQLEDERKWTEIGLRRVLNEEDFKRIDQLTKEKAERSFVITRERQQEKFQRSVRRDEQRKEGQLRKTSNAVDRTRWVINHSNHEVTPQELAVLQRGLNFAQSPNSLPMSKIVAGIEPALRQCNDPEAAERARSIIASIIRQHRPPKPNTTAEERQAMRTLKQDEEIVILQADKGNTTVLLNTTEYVEKAEAILSKPPFKRLQRNPTRRNEKRVNDVLKRLADRAKISRELHASLRVPSNGTKPPLFYGSVKVHKDGYPLRPIVSMIGSATYSLSKYISHILTPYVRRTPSYIANTSELLLRLKDMHIAQDEIMVSFDVKSLFTSIPKEDAFEAIRQTIEGDPEFRENNGVAQDAFLEILKVCLSTTGFQFRGKHYELSDGLPMGSPASPAIANLFMSKLEEDALKSFDGAPTVWYRYVDDVFSIVKRRLVEKLLAHMNTQHPSITFTIEEEENGKLPFLDAHIQRIDGSLRMSVYRKPTHTGRYLAFTSHHPESAKRSVVQSLFRRVEYITLGDEEKQKEEQRIIEELTANHYPATFIKKVAKKDRKKLSTRKQTETTMAVASIPYIKGLSEGIQRVLAKLEIRTTMKPVQSKWSFMCRAKDTIPPKESPGVVYAIGCLTCPKIYIGETNRTAKQRALEHRCHTRTGTVEQSAIADHAHTTGHDIHWEPRVIAKEPRTASRKVTEAIVIHQLGKGKIMNHDCGLDVSKLFLNLMKPRS